MKSHKIAFYATNLSNDRLSISRKGQSLIQRTTLKDKKLKMHNRHLKAKRMICTVHRLSSNGEESDAADKDRVRIVLLIYN